MAGNLKVVQFSDKEMSTLDDMNAIGSLEIANLMAYHTYVHAALSGQGIQVISGLSINAQGTPNGTVKLVAGTAIDQLNLILLEILTDQTVNILSGTENKTGGIWGTGQAADATNPRKDVIGIKALYLDSDSATRTFYDTVAKNTYNNTVNTRHQNHYDIVVVHGTAAATPVEPALPAGYTKQAVITVPANSNVVNQSNIAGSRPVVRNRAPGLTVQLQGDGAGTDNVFEVKSRTGTTLFYIQDNGTLPTLATSITGNAATVGGYAPGAAAGNLAILDANGRAADATKLQGATPSVIATANAVALRDGSGALAGNITGDAATVGGKSPGTTAGKLVYSDVNNKLPYSITGDAATVGGKSPGTAAGNLIYSDVNNKLPYSITGDAATVAGKVPGSAAGNLVVLDASAKVPFSITGDAATVAGKVPGAASGNLAILDVNARVQDSAKLVGYVPNTSTTASTIPVRDASGKLPGSITGDAATVGGVGLSGLLQTSGGSISGNLSITGTLTVTSTVSFGGALTMNFANAGMEIGAQGTANAPFIDFHSGATNVDYDVRLAASGGNGTVGNGTLNVVAGTFTMNGNTIWHAGNDGTGSGLDADTLDGNQASYFATATHNHDTVYLKLAGGTLTGNLIIRLDTNALALQTSAGVEVGRVRANTAGAMFISGTSSVYLRPNGDASANYQLYLDNTGAFTFNGNTVWHAGNDGSGSSLDADTLDGSHASAFETPTGSQTKADTATEEGLVIETALPVTNAEPVQVQTTLGPAIEFADGVTRSVVFNRRWPFSGANVKMEIVAAMDTSYAGNVQVQVGWQVNGGAVTNVPITVTTLASTTGEVVIDLGQIVAAASASQGSILTFTLSRLGADVADTHTGKLRIYHTRLKKG